MAKVFLSYDREDLAKARSVAGYLEKAGHAVWWDRNIRGGAQYTREIEKALDDSDAVVVLWSTASVNSEWVRDEAAEGRERGTLVPVLLEPVKPPMGFRQFQTIDIADWNASPSKRAPLLLEALSTGAPASPRSALRSEPARAKRVLTLNRRSIAALAALALIIAAGAAWFLTKSSGEVPTVTVVAADSSPESRELASDLMIKLAKLQSATANMRLIDPASSDGKQADLKFEVRDSSGGNSSRAGLALMSEKDRMILWSTDFEDKDGNRANLQLQLSYTAARLLGCAMEALPARGPRLPQDLLRPYLNACAILGERYTHDVSQAIPLFALVTEKAPKFEPAWSKLLLAETDRYLAVSPNEAQQISAQLRKHIAQARRVNPDLVEAFLAEAELASGDAFSERARLIDRALSVDPDNVYALSARAGFYQDIGRMGDAVDDAQRAVQLDPLSPAMRNLHIAALAYAGRMAAAEAALAEAERLWPGATTLIDARYRLSLRYGDPAEAMRLQDIGAVQAGGRLRQSFLQARMNPTPENVENAIAIARSIHQRAPISIGELVQTLGEFNQEEELFQILINWRRRDEIPFLADVLFRPPMKELWYDPRFMKVGKTMGMLDYWRANNIWPDFCADPRLPYDCKAEAAKLGQI